MDWTAPRTSRWSKESLGSAAASHKPPQGRAILLHSPGGHKDPDHWVIAFRLANPYSFTQVSRVYT